jgi:hypothetical protein
MRAISRLSRSGKLFAAVVAAGAAFGIASAVQASIPDSNAIVHSCYNTSLAHGNPIGAMRAIDTATPSGNCAPWEGAVDLATPQYVQNVVTSTINQTSFLITFTNTLPASQWFDFYNCGSGWIAMDPTLSTTPVNEVSNGAIVAHTWMNVGDVNTGVPNDQAQIRYDTTAGPFAYAHHATCINGRVFGLAGPAVPIASAMSQASAGTKTAS